MEDDFFRRVDPATIARAEHNLKRGVLTQEEYELIIGIRRRTLEEIKPYLRARITIEEFESRYGTSERWKEEKEHLVESDELWEFKRGEYLAMQSGVFIIRDSEVIRTYVFGRS